jgi:CheY-like chemotaxis protein
VCFRGRVYVDREAILDGASVEGEGEGKGKARKRVLIVDDDRLLAETLRALIREQAEAEIQVVTSGLQAAKLLESDGRFDAIICDLGMPGIDGIALYERLAQRGSPLASRFLFVTGGVFAESTSTFLARASVPCLQKPFDSRTLGSVLAPLLAE